MWSLCLAWFCCHAVVLAAPASGPVPPRGKRSVPPRKTLLVRPLPRKRVPPPTRRRQTPPPRRRPATREPVSRRSPDPLPDLVASIKLRGLKHVKSELVRRWIFLQEGEAFSRKTLMADLRRLRKTGYFAKLSARLTRNKGLVYVEYVFQERGGRIKAVYFNGHTIYTSRQLMTQIQLQPGTFFHQQRLKEDAERLIYIYHSVGYFQVRVTVQGRWQGQDLTFGL